MSVLQCAAATTSGEPVSICLRITAINARRAPSGIRRVGASDTLGTDRVFRCGLLGCGAARTGRCPLNAFARSTAAIGRSRKISGGRSPRRPRPPPRAVGGNKFCYLNIKHISNGYDVLPLDFYDTAEVESARHQRRILWSSENCRRDDVYRLRTTRMSNEAIMAALCRRRQRARPTSDAAARNLNHINHGEPYDFLETTTLI
ncbi:hypothetical protein EVAR_103800_1 [Eumeta japonica]|uniref:Uncharacterized protein n=1 Tax=Eumeta variegata TaxID=151549 RepID=A0A4C1Z031_EUMVA|nr:hypothetical protein EVAR_103800_1 [Eumeta japonica]